jgi:hypothetical protein
LLMAGLVVLVGLAAVVLWPPPSRVTRENYDRIQAGMSRAEVDAILGPPGDYRTGPTRDGGGYRWRYIDESPKGWNCFWRADTCDVSVSFDTSGRVEQQLFNPDEKTKQGAIHDLLWRIERARLKWFAEW